MLRSGLDQAYDVALATRVPAPSPPDRLTRRLRRVTARCGQRNLRHAPRSPDTVPIVDPIRNPYAPGAGQRPPELAGRDEQLRAFDVVLERVARGRPERSLVLTGLRGVGKTVLLNALRSLGRTPAAGAPASSRPGPTRRLRRPLSQRAAPGRARARPPAGRRRRPRARRDPVLRPARGRHRRQAARPVAPRHRRTGGEGPRRLRRHRDRPGRAVHRPRRAGRRRRQGRRGLHRRDAGPRARRRLRPVRGLPRDQPVGPAGDRGRRRAAAPARGAVARASPTPSGCSATSASTGWPARPPTARSPRPPRDEDAAFADDALAAMYAATGGYPYFIQAYGKVVWDLAPRSPITADGRRGRRAARPRPSSPSASSAAGSSGRRRGSATTSAPWPTPPS